MLTKKLVAKSLFKFKKSPNSRNNLRFFVEILLFESLRCSTIFVFGNNLTSSFVPQLAFFPKTKFCPTTKKLAPYSIKILTKPSPLNC